MYKVPLVINIPRAATPLTPRLGSSSVMTRSMARAAAQQSLGQPTLAQQVRDINNPAFNMSNYGGSVERLQSVQNSNASLRGSNSRLGSTVSLGSNPMLRIGSD